jgi:hypothetical protein
MKSGDLVKIIEDEIGQLKGSCFIGKVGLLLEEHKTFSRQNTIGFDILIEGTETFLLLSMMSQVQK